MAAAVGRDTATIGRSSGITGAPSSSSSPIAAATRAAAMAATAAAAPGGGFFSFLCLSPRRGRGKAAALSQNVRCSLLEGTAKTAAAPAMSPSPAEVFLLPSTQVPPSYSSSSLSSSSSSSSCFFSSLPPLFLLPSAAAAGDRIGGAAAAAASPSSSSSSSSSSSTASAAPPPQLHSADRALAPLAAAALRPRLHRVASLACIRHIDRAPKRRLPPPPVRNKERHRAEAMVSCRGEKERYDQCWNHWYRYHFTKGRLLQDTCGHFFEEYRACIMEELQQKGLAGLTAGPSLLEDSPRPAAAAATAAAEEEGGQTTAALPAAVGKGVSSAAAAAAAEKNGGSAVGEGREGGSAGAAL